MEKRVECDLGRASESVFASDADFLQRTETPLALSALGRLVSEQYRLGASPMAPRAWGLFLERVGAQK